MKLYLCSFRLRFSEGQTGNSLHAISALKKPAILFAAGEFARRFPYMNPAISAKLVHKASRRSVQLHAFSRSLYTKQAGGVYNRGHFRGACTQSRATECTTSCVFAECITRPTEHTSPRRTPKELHIKKKWT